MKSPKLAAFISLALLVAYLFLLSSWAIHMILTGVVIGMVIGTLLMVFPALGAWAIYREYRFGSAAEKLGKRLEDANEWPVFQLVLRPSGRPTKESADENFKVFHKQVEQKPDDWRNWYALSLAYDACGDRPRARQAMAKAISLAKP